MSWSIDRTPIQRILILTLLITTQTACTSTRVASELATGFEWAGLRSHTDLDASTRWQIPSGSAIRIEAHRHRGESSLAARCGGGRLPGLSPVPADAPQICCCASTGQRIPHLRPNIRRSGTESAMLCRVRGTESKCVCFCVTPAAVGFCNLPHSPWTRTGSVPAPPARISSGTPLRPMHDPFPAVAKTVRPGC